MKMWIWGLLVLSLPVAAQQRSIELESRSGEQFSLYELDNGERWASFYLSDNTLAQFDLHELIVLQIDNHKPIKLEQGLRSCGAPAGKPQQISYQFIQEDQKAAWEFQGTAQSRTDVLKLLGWDQAEYDKIQADRRDVVVDFPIREDWFYRQLQSAEKLTFRYTTNDGEVHETQFILNEAFELTL